MSNDAKSRKCLQCDNVPATRGLCWNHYQQFVRAKNSLPKCDREAFINQLIDKGMVGGTKRKDGKVASVFNVALLEFEQEKNK